MRQGLVFCLVEFFVAGLLTFFYNPAIAVIEAAIAFLLWTHWESISNILQRRMVGICFLIAASGWIFYQIGQLSPESERHFLGFSTEALSSATFYIYNEDGTCNHYELHEDGLSTIYLLQQMYKAPLLNPPMQQPLYSFELHYSTDWPVGNIIIYPDYLSINGASYSKPDDIVHKDYTDFITGVMERVLLQEGIEK